MYNLQFIYYLFTIELFTIYMDAWNDTMIKWYINCTLYICKLYIDSPFTIFNFQSSIYYMKAYDDIINLPHHVSKKHPQMSMLQRAAQFAPFAALAGHEEAIARRQAIAQSSNE